MSAITISLDAVVLDDGTFIGTNETKAYEQATASTSSPRTLMTEVLTRHGAGHSDETLFAWVKSQTAQNPNVKNFASIDWNYAFRRSAAMDLFKLYQQQGSKSAYIYAAKLLGQPVLQIKSSSRMMKK